MTRTVRSLSIFGASALVLGFAAVAGCSSGGGGFYTDGGIPSGSDAGKGPDGSGGSDGGTTGSITFALVTNQTAVANHWPGPDGLIGNADDFVGSTPSPTNKSDPNNLNSYSMNAFDFGTHQTESGLLPNKMNAATFLKGTIAADPTVAASGGGPIITGWDLQGTQPFQGHGPYDAKITKVNSGTYNPTSRDFSINIDITATLAAGPASATGVVLAGEAYLAQSADIGQTTGNAYIDNVVAPLAMNLGAKAVFFAHATGTVPASSSGTGTFPSMPLVASIVAISK